jgi:uncharacterized Zn finger protein
MGVRRAEPHMYEVENKTKGTRYHVGFTRRGESLFASCDCPAGIRHGKAPMMCKHVAAAVIALKGIQDARRLPEAEANGAAYDGND